MNPFSFSGGNSGSLFRALFDQIPIAALLIDHSGVVVKKNPAFSSFWASGPEIREGSFNILTSVFPHSCGFDDALTMVFRGKGESSREYQLDLSSYGDIRGVRTVFVTMVPVLSGRRVTNVFLLIEDVTDQRVADEKIHRLVFYDTLTGLPNRNLMLDRIGQRLSYLQRYPRNDALVLINIDRFRVINDARGNQVGDALLVAIGKRLASLMREADTVARMNADEFAVLLPSDEINAVEISMKTLIVIERIRESLKTPFELDGERAIVTASFGVTLLPTGKEDTPVAVLRRADTALHRAKAAGGGHYAFFDPDMGNSASESYRVERELRSALANGELRVFLQPQVNARREFVSAEVLVRWQHPTRGLVFPGSFIPIAEQTDLIIDVGEWVMERACEILVDTGAQGFPLRLSVNVSPRQFRHRQFVPWMRELIARTGADASCLTLEITESLFMGDLENTVTKMGQLTELGVRFSVDDFGTGYSSLAYIKQLPIHELKIDKAFVQDAPTDANDAALVETILAVAALLNLSVVAEGVESEPQAEFLNSRAEVTHQGYLFGRPEPAENWVEKWKRTGSGCIITS